jgi:hypothetical protein
VLFERADEPMGRRSGESRRAGDIGVAARTCFDGVEDLDGAIERADRRRGPRSLPESDLVVLTVSSRSSFHVLRFPSVPHTGTEFQMMEQ